MLITSRQKIENLISTKFLIILNEKSEEFSNELNLKRQ